jgi:hypothetical protein
METDQGDEQILDRNAHGQKVAPELYLFKLRSGILPPGGGKRGACRQDCKNSEWDVCADVGQLDQAFDFTDIILRHNQHVARSQISQRLR